MSDDEDGWETEKGDWGDLNDTEEFEPESKSSQSSNIIEKYSDFPKSENEKAIQESQMVNDFIGFTRDGKQKLKEHLNEIVVIRNKESLTSYSETRLNVLKTQLRDNSAFKDTIKELNRSITNAKTNLQRQKDNLQKDISTKKSKIETQLKNNQTKRQIKFDELDRMKSKFKRAIGREKKDLKYDIETLEEEMNSIDNQIQTIKNNINKIKDDYEFKSDIAYIEKGQKDIDNKIATLNFIQSLADMDSDESGQVTVVGLIERKEPIQTQLLNLERQFDRNASEGIINYGLLPGIYRNAIELAKIENLIKDNIDKTLNTIEKLKINRTKMERNMRKIQNIRDTLNHRLTTVKMISASNGNEFRVPPDIMNEYKEKIKNLENTISENRKTIKPFKKIDEETETVMKTMIKDYKDILEGKIDKELTNRIMSSYDVLNDRLQVYKKEFERIRRDIVKINREIEMTSRELSELYASDDKQCPICANYKFLESCYQCSFEMCTDCRGTQSRCPSCSSQFAEYKVEEKDKFYEKYGKYGDAIVSAIIMISPQSGNTYGADSSIGTMIGEMEKFVNAVNRKYEQSTGQKNRFDSLNGIIDFVRSNPGMNLDPMEEGGISIDENEIMSRVAEMSRRDEEERYMRQLERERMRSTTGIESKRVIEEEFKYPDKTTMAGIINEYLPNRVSISEFVTMSDEELKKLYKSANKRKLLIEKLIRLQNIQNLDQIDDLKTYTTEELETMVRSMED
jgi:hypothetical protein